MLRESEIEYSYRDYREHPLDKKEIRAVLAKLGVRAKDVLRRRDRAFRELSLTGSESEARLIAHIAEHPTLLERPIGVLGERAVVGRPPERLLSLTEG